MNALTHLAGRLTKPTAIDSIRRALRLVNIWVAFTAIAAILVLVAASANSLEWMPPRFHVFLVNVSYNIIAAFVFYVFLDLVPKIQEASSLAPYVCQRIQRLKGDVESVCRAMGEASNHQVNADWKVNADDVTSWFSAVRADAPAPMVFFDLSRANMYEYIKHQCRRSDQLLADLIQIAPYLGADLVGQIGLMQRDGYLWQVRESVPLERLKKGHTLAYLSKEILDHYRRLERLELTASGRGLVVRRPWN
ncbi:MAG: hypothetical protein ABSD21_10765 [Rhizomicrobium sp.]